MVVVYISVYIHIAICICIHMLIMWSIIMTGEDRVDIVRILLIVI